MISTTDSAKRILKQNDMIPESLNIFGAPSFVVKNELFWGQDRLQDALDWSQP